MTQPHAAPAAPPAPRPTLKQLIAESGAGGKYFPFARIGDSIEGKVLDVKIIQARDFRTKELQTWASGDPMYNVVATVQGLPDPTDPEHDGAWSAYIKWWGTQRMALQQALSQAGVDDIVVGGWLKATYVADGPAQAGMNPPKLIEFVYRPPAQAAGLAGLPSGPAAPVAPPTYAAPPVTPPYPQGYNGIPVQGQPGLFPPGQSGTYGAAVVPQAPAPTPPAPPAPPAAAAPAAPAPTSADLTAQFAMIRQGLASGMTPAQITLMIPGVDMATVQAIAAAPVQ